MNSIDNAFLCLTRYADRRPVLVPAVAMAFCFLGTCGAFAALYETVALL
jgi:hypothetical protein